MIWKPKERQLTREEAIELAKKELKPLWFGTEPLLAGVRSAGKAGAHPLDQRILTAPWLLTLVDATSFSGQAALNTVAIWHTRYAQLGFQFLIVLRFPSQGLFRPSAILERFEKELAAGMKIVVDYDGSLAAAFGFSGHCCKSVALINGKPHAETVEPGWAPKTETLIQGLLREKDPGLPLLRPLGDKKDGIRDLSAVEFGAIANSPALKLIPAANAEKTSPPEQGQVLAIGEWIRGAEKMTTSDPNARILLRSPGTDLAILAQPIEHAQNPPRMVVEINGMMAYEEYFGPGMKMDDDGFTQIPLNTSWFYQPVTRLAGNFRDITLKFPDAKSQQIVLFGIRFGTAAP